MAKRRRGKSQPGAARPPRKDSAMNNYPAESSATINPADVGQRRMPAMGLGQGMM